MEALQAGNGKKRPKRKLQLKKLIKHVSPKQTNKQIVSVVVNNLIQGLSRKQRRKKKVKKPISKPVELKSQSQSALDNAIDRQLGIYMKFLGYSQEDARKERIRNLSNEIKQLEDKKKQQVLAELRENSILQIEGKKQIEESKPIEESKEDVSIEDVTNIELLKDKLEEQRSQLDKINNAIKKTNQDRHNTPVKSTEYTRLSSQKTRQTTIQKEIIEKIKKLENQLKLAEQEEKVEEKEEEEKKEEQGEQTGLGKLLKRLKREGGLYDYEIEDVMKNTPNWGGVIPSDKFDDIPAKKDLNIIVNLDKSNQAGSHWVAVRIDSNSKSVEYYDSLAGKPPDNIDKGIKSLFHRINPPPSHLYKYKYNTKPTQNALSTTCGYHSMLFLLQRNKGHTFKEATNFDEKDIEDAKIKGTFDYI